MQVRVSSLPDGTINPLGFTVSEYQTVANHTLFIDDLPLFFSFHSRTFGLTTANVAQRKVLLCRRYF
jgi:hypothetical protein